MNSVKILGVYLDNNSKWDTHFKYIYNKASRAFGLIRKLLHAGVGGVLIVRAYQALVRCHIYYAWPALCDMQNTHITFFKRFDERILKLTNLSPPDLALSLTKFADG